jgi:hypothetical protein
MEEKKEDEEKINEKISKDFVDTEDDLDEEEKEEILEEKKTSIFLLLFVFLLALIPRIYFIFFVSGTQNAAAGWYGDNYHHWQIAYLSKEIGLKIDPFRLWDLKGMEYFWGILHPYTLVILFTITGSSDILIERLLAVFCGSVSVVLIFLIIRRYFNFQAALTGAVLAALFPVTVFNDALGIEESLGIMFLLAGVYFWPKKPFFVGIFWALAALTRAEYWVFGIGLIFAIGLLERKFEKLLVLAAPYIVITVFYMKILVDKTGNPIYPIWWNYLANAAGQWEFREKLTSYQLQAREVFTFIIIIAAFAILITLWKKPKYYLYLLLGFGNWLFIGLFIGWSAYLKSYEVWFWMIRFFVLPYSFLLTLFTVFVFYSLIKKAKIIETLKINWLIFLSVLALSQILWLPILNNFKGTKARWESVKVQGELVGKYYQGGKILIPVHEYDPDFTYTLVQFGGVKGKNIVGQMYDPFYYLGEEKAFDNWGSNREVVLNWLKEENIRTIVVDKERSPYKLLFEKEKKLFRKVADLGTYRQVIYEVVQK